MVVVAPDGELLLPRAVPNGGLAEAAGGRRRAASSCCMACNTPMRGQGVPTGIEGAPPVVVGVATDISHQREHMMDGFGVTLWSFVAIAALLTGILGWLAARRGVAPLNAMKQKAESITAQRLNARLEVDAVPVDGLIWAETLNAMLARLEDLFRRLSDFSSDPATNSARRSATPDDADVTLARPVQPRNTARRWPLQHRGIRAAVAHDRRHAVHRQGGRG